MTYQEYISSVNVELARRMDEILTMNKLDDKVKVNTLKLIKQNGDSLTSLYYKMLVKSYYDDLEIDAKVEREFREAKGNLFIDYILVKNMFVKNREYVDGMSMIKSLSIMKISLEDLAKDGVNEAKYLLADLYSLDLKKTKNLSLAYSMFYDLIGKGHVASNYKIAMLILDNQSVYHNYILDAIDYLKDALAKGVRRAAYVLYDIFSKGLYNIQKDENLAKKYQSLINSYEREKVMLASPNDALLNRVNTEETLDEEEEIQEDFNYKEEYKRLRFNEKSSELCFAFIDKHFDLDPTFFLVEKAKLYFELNKRSDASKCLIQISSIDDEDIKEYAYDIAVIYQKYKNKNMAIKYHKISSKINKHSALFLARYYENNNDNELAKIYYLLLTTFKEYNAYIKLYQLSVKDGEYTKGIEYLEEGANLNNAACENELGMIYYYGKETIKDRLIALNHFQEGYNLNSVNSTFYLGLMMYEGDHCVENKEGGLKLINKAIKNGFIDQKGEASHILNKSFKSEAQYLKKMYSKHKNVNCARKLAMLYYDNKKYANAKDYLKIAVKKGDAKSAFLLGTIYSEKSRFDRNYQLAIKYFNEAIYLGYEDVEYELGYACYKLRRYEEARVHFRNAASKEHKYAYYYLSILHHKKLIKNYSEKDAIYFANKSVENGLKTPFKII